MNIFHVLEEYFILRLIPSGPYRLYLKNIYRYLFYVSLTQLYYEIILIINFNNYVADYLFFDKKINSYKNDSSRP